MKEQIDIIVKKQCEFVGADFDKIDYKKNDWFFEFEWSKRTEDDFCSWLAVHLRTSKDARMAVMKHNTTNSILCLKAANEWVLQYGWKTKE